MDWVAKVICDKPLTATLPEAKRLAKAAEASGVVFALTHNYTGYPMIRQAAAMVRSGALGDIRVVQVEYAQDWLAEPIEQTGQKQADWRTDPARSGAGGATGEARPVIFCQSSAAMNQAQPSMAPPNMPKTAPFQPTKAPRAPPIHPPIARGANSFQFTLRFGQGRGGECQRGGGRIEAAAVAAQLTAATSTQGYETT